MAAVGRYIYKLLPLGRSGAVAHSVTPYICFGGTVFVAFVGLRRGAEVLDNNHPTSGAATQDDTHIKIFAMVAVVSLNRAISTISGSA